MRLINEALHHTSRFRWRIGISEPLIGDRWPLAGMQIEARGMRAPDAASVILAEIFVGVVDSASAGSGSLNRNHEMFSRDVGGYEPV